MFLRISKGLPGALQLMTRKRDDSCHADVLSDYNLSTTQGQRDAAWPSVSEDSSTWNRMSFGSEAHSDHTRGRRQMACGTGAWRVASGEMGVVDVTVTFIGARKWWGRGGGDSITAAWVW